jgi:signal peptidase I
VLSLRTIIERCVWILLAAAVLETWLAAGLVMPCHIAGGSMAETLLGEHRSAVCADCGRRFVFDAASAAPPVRLVCPNCGHVADASDASGNIAGDCVVVDRAAFQFRPPRRWEVVALRDPRRAETILVKRIVGLPGETVEIRDGNVYIDGNIVRKTLAEQRAMAVLVHDADYSPPYTKTLPSRWRAENDCENASPFPPKTLWRQSGGTFSHPSDSTADVAPAANVDWLVYHHQRRLPDGEATDAAIADVCGYNQATPRREEVVHAVADLFLALRLAEIKGGGDFCVRASDGTAAFEARLQFAENSPRQFRWLIRRAGQNIASASETCSISDADCREGILVEASIMDRQFILAVAERTLAAIPFEPDAQQAKSPKEYGSHPSQKIATVAVGVARLGATIQHLRVYRDIYYSAGTRGAATLREGCFFVLGDNSAISDDSRIFGGDGSVCSNLLIGKPLTAIPVVETERRQFQVPNWLKIRYIH